MFPLQYTGVSFHENEKCDHRYFDYVVDTMYYHGNTFVMSFPSSLLAKPESLERPVSVQNGISTETGADPT